jgi:rhodanese-related sulfurtransferase
MSPLTKLFLFVIGVMLFFTVRSMLAQSNKAAAATMAEPKIAAEKVRAGEAIIIDVREPNEWESGVAAPAYLLPLSDLRGERTKWEHVLANADKDQPIYLYCRSGARSGEVATILTKEGFTAANIGGFRDWQAAKLPTRTPDEPAGND